MEWYPQLYIGKSAQKNKDRRICSIKHGKYLGNTWLITLASNAQNQLDILPACNLKFSWLEHSCPLIVGVAAGWEDALELVQSIVEEVYRSTGDVRIREYLTARMQA